MVCVNWRPKTLVVARVLQMTTQDGNLWCASYDDKRPALWCASNDDKDSPCVVRQMTIQKRPLVVTSLSTGIEAQDWAQTTDFFCHCQRCQFQLEWSMIDWSDENGRQLQSFEKKGPGQEMVHLNLRYLIQVFNKKEKFWVCTAQDPRQLTTVVSGLFWISDSGYVGDAISRQSNKSILTNMLS